MGAVASVLLVAGVVGWWLGRSPTDASPPDSGEVRGDPEPEAPHPPASNVARDDYVGPEACRECHEAEYAKWHAHPHRRMNANAGADTVVGDFSGATRTYGGIETTFSREGDRFVMSYRRGDELLRRDAVTRTIGSRLQQAYVGVQIEGPEPEGDPIYETERALPWVYWFSREQWYPEHYVEQYPLPEHDDDGALNYPTDDPYSRGARPWSEGCMLCHNTYAFTGRFARDVPGRGFSEATLAGPPPDGPTPDDLVTLGVSCEACHFGGRDHVAYERDVVPVPEGGPVTTTLARGRRSLNNPYLVNSICAQCHVAGALPYPNGASSLNSSEALDMLSGECTTTISCVDCHDPHAGNPPGGGPDDPAHVDACVTCHRPFAKEERRQAHARHDADDASCLDCHMIRINQGIDVVVRSHRIDSPTNPQMLAAAAPNACNLCHLDRSMRWTLDALAQGWGKTIEPDDDWSDAYGEGLALPMLQVWLQHDTPIVRLVTADAIARSPRARTFATDLLSLLSDPYPNNRMFGMFALERVLGRNIEGDDYDPVADLAERQRQIDALAVTLAQ